MRSENSKFSNFYRLGKVGKLGIFKVFVIFWELLETVYVCFSMVTTTQEVINLAMAFNTYGLRILKMRTIVLKQFFSNLR